MTLCELLFRLNWGTKIRIYLTERLSLNKPLWIADYLYIEHNTIDEALLNYDVIGYYVEDNFLCIELETKGGKE